MNQERMWIMIAGPYGFKAKNDEDRRTNLSKLNSAAVAVFQKGHIPIIGVNMALPMIEAAGDGSYSEIMMPISLGLCERCDAILRLEGDSSGADREVAEFEKRGLTVYRRIEEIPTAIT